MQFDLNKSIEILANTPSVLKSYLSGLSDPWVRNNEGEDSFSPYDVVGHLVYGEKTDWIVRIQIIMDKSEDKTFEPYDRYAQFDEDQSKPITDLLNEFAELRLNNIETLKSANIEKWDYTKTGIHPEFGEVNLAQLISTWVVHDLGHIAQISRVMANQYDAEVGPFKAYLRILKSSK